MSFMRVFTRYKLSNLAACCFGVVAACAVARADIANLGQLSFDQVNPGAVDGFTVLNFTGGFALPPDFAVTDTAILQSATLVLTTPLGVLPAISLGDIGPGVTSPATLQFLDTEVFSSAEFRATLAQSAFSLFDGRLFTADSSVIDIFLLPSSGTALAAGLDMAVISVSGTVTEATVPEPSGWWLLLTVLLLVAARRPMFRELRWRKPV